MIIQPAPSMPYLLLVITFLRQQDLSQGLHSHFSNSVVFTRHIDLIPCWPWIREFCFWLHSISYFLSSPKWKLSPSLNLFMLHFAVQLSIHEEDQEICICYLDHRYSLTFYVIVVIFLHSLLPFKRKWLLLACWVCWHLMVLENMSTCSLGPDSTI